MSTPILAHNGTFSSRTYFPYHKIEFGYVELYTTTYLTFHFLTHHVSFWVDQYNICY